MKRSTVFRLTRLAAIGVLSMSAAGAFAAAGSEHPGTTPGEMRYKGAPVPMQESKDVITPGAPALTEAEFAKLYGEALGDHGAHFNVADAVGIRADRLEETTQ